MVTEEWILRVWDDEEIIYMARARIRAREVDIGTVDPGTPIDIGKSRIH